MNILITTTEYNPMTKGGAHKSIKNLVDGLDSIENIQVKILTQGVKNKFLKFFNLDAYLSSLKIIRTFKLIWKDIISTRGVIGLITELKNLILYFIMIFKT